jgi:glutaredoxin
MVKKYLTSKGFSYTEVNIDEEPDRREEAFAVSGALTVPVTVIKSGANSQEIIVGWNPSRLIPALV